MENIVNYFVEDDFLKKKKPILYIDLFLKRLIDNRYSVRLWYITQNNMKWHDIIQCFIVPALLIGEQSEKTFSSFQKSSLTSSDKTQNNLSALLII